MKVLLRHVAHTRAGDKGNTSSIGVFAYEPQLYPCLKEQLTAVRVAHAVGGVVQGKVVRHEADQLHAMNFVLEQALAGGVSRSLRLDQYGKTLSAVLLGLELEVPDALFHLLVGRHLLPAMPA